MKFFPRIFIFLVLLQSTDCEDFFGGLEGPQVKPATSESTKKTVKSSKRKVKKRVSGKYKVLSKPKVTTKSRFNPYYDAPKFVNFASISTGNQEGQKFTSGTCYGVSYLTSIWYAGIVQELAKHKKAKAKVEDTIGIRDLNFGQDYDLLNQVCNGAGPEANECAPGPIESSMPESNMDGLTYIASLAHQTEPGFFNRCGKHFKKCRLYDLSRHNFLKDHVQKAMIHHHNQQDLAKDVELDVQNPDSLQRQMHDLKRIIDQNGSAFFYWYVYSTKDQDKKESERNYDEFEAGHAMLAYRYARVRVNADGENKNAIKVFLYDPNMKYRNFKKISSPEGYGSYLLYFPDLKKLSFSNATQAFYSENSGSSSGDAANIAKNLQGGKPFIDGKQTRVGYTDFYEGHQNQFGDVAHMSTFITGQVVTDQESQIWNVLESVETCEKVGELLGQIRDADKKDGDNRETRFQTWYTTNYGAVQNLLRENDVIQDEEECDPWH